MVSCTGVGVGGHVIANRNNNDNDDDVSGNHNVSSTSVSGIVGTVEGSDSEDGTHVGSSSVRTCKSVSFDVETLKSIASTTTNI